MYFKKFSWLFIGCTGSLLLCSGFSLVVASRGYSLVVVQGFSLWWHLLLQSTGSMCVGFSSCHTLGSVVVAPGLQSLGSIVVAHALSCSEACGIFLGQGSNPCPLSWQVYSYPLYHQGSPQMSFYTYLKNFLIAKVKQINYRIWIVQRSSLYSAKR